MLTLKFRHTAKRRLAGKQVTAIIGVVAYFVFRSATFALGGTVRGSAVPPANQTNAGNPSPPGAAPAAAAVPYAYAPPGRVPVRRAGAPQVRRWTTLDPDTLRDALQTPTLLVSIMAVNNETGVIQDLAGLATIAKQATERRFAAGKRTNSFWPRANTSASL